MPSSVASLLDAAGLQHAGVVTWGSPVPERGPGVYLVSLNETTDSIGAAQSSASLSEAALAEWLRVRPELRVDGRRPTVDDLAARLRGFWLPDEVILYIGLATSLRSRIGGYYGTPLGARRPHAGGFFLKTLANLDDLYVHLAKTDDPTGAEHQLLAAYCDSVSIATKARLVDPDHPFPFANLEWPPGVRKRHGITGARGDVPSASEKHFSSTRGTRSPQTLPRASRGGVRMHRSQFTSDEIKLISTLLIELRRAERARQKAIRGRLRDLGFYITDYATDQQGFTASDLDDLLRRGTISVEGDE